MCFSLYTAAVTDDKAQSVPIDYEAQTHVLIATQRGYRGGSPTAVQA